MSKNIKIPGKSGKNKVSNLVKDPREKRIIQYLQSVYNITLEELSKKLSLRKATVKLLLERMEKKGIVILEKTDDRLVARYNGYLKRKNLPENDIAYR